MQGAPQDEVVLDYQPAGQDDDGELYKFNSSYQFGDDVLAYLTVSEGYRVGSSNGVTQCSVPLDPVRTFVRSPMSSNTNPTRPPTTKSAHTRPGSRER